MKRQRGYSDAGSDPRRKLSPFGQESIIELSKEGNSTLARGGFGEITIVIQITGETNHCHFAAVKTIGGALIASHDDEPVLSEDVINEVHSLRILSSHKNIVPLIGMYQARNNHSKLSLSLVFPYSPSDLQLSLEWRRRTFQPLLPLCVVKSIARDMFHALYHCHNSGIVHNDVKPGNLLVSSSGVIQLCDFGIAESISDDDGKCTINNQNQKALCTLNYRSPEVLFGGPTSKPPADLYSAGTVIAELVTGTTLFPGQNVIDQLSLIFDFLGTPTEATWPTATLLPDFGKLNFTSKTPKTFAEIAPRVTEDFKLLELLSRMVMLDPSKRLTAEGALEHEWLVLTKHPKSSYQTVRQELIPAKLREPVLLVPDKQSVASKVAITLAGKRRSFLNSLTSWSGPKVSKDTIESVCQDMLQKSHI